MRGASAGGKNFLNQRRDSPRKLGNLFHLPPRARRNTYAPRAARPFGALNDCNAPRNNFSKFAAPVSRFASDTAVSAARPSYPRFTSADTTSASIPAGDDAAGFSVSIATDSSLSFNSTTMRSEERRVGKE